MIGLASFPVFCCYSCKERFESGRLYRRIWTESTRWTSRGWKLILRAQAHQVLLRWSRFAGNLAGLLLSQARRLLQKSPQYSFVYSSDKPRDNTWQRKSLLCSNPSPGMCPSWGFKWGDQLLRKWMSWIHRDKGKQGKIRLGYWFCLVYRDHT